MVGSRSGQGAWETCCRSNSVPVLAGRRPEAHADEVDPFRQSHGLSRGRIGLPERSEKEDMRTRAVVTGAAGFIGSHLTEALLAAGHPVVGIDAFTPYYRPSIKRANIAAACRHPSFQLLTGDLNQLDLTEVLRPGDVVFHLAAQPGVRSSWGPGFADYTRHNVDATQRLLEAAARRKVAKLVYASSSSVYGEAPRPMREEGPLEPVSPYGVTKLTAEQLCMVYWRSFGLPVVALRLFTVYGPRQRPDMAFHRLIEAVLDGEPATVFGDGRQERDFTFVSDVVSILVIAAERAEPGSVVNVGGGSSVSVLETITIVERLLGRQASLEYVAGPPGDARSTEASTERLRSLGATVDVGIEEGLRRQVAWHLSLRKAGGGPGRSRRDWRSSNPKTVLLYSHDTYGLGHLRRNSAIAQALVNADPGVRVCLITGSSLADQVPMPAIEVLRMPSAVKVGAESYRAADSRSTAGLLAERAGTIASALLRLRPDVFLVDHSALGMKGELRLALKLGHDGLLRTRFVLGLRDVLDNPAIVRRTWLEQGVYRALHLFYDQIMVYGCRDLFDVTERYALTAFLKRRTIFTGYVAKPEGLEGRSQGEPCWPSVTDGRIRILVTAGGGGDGYRLFESFMEVWPELAQRALGILVTGPLLEEGLHRSVAARAGRLPGLQIVRFATNMLSLIAASDLVVTMGGYNSVVEALAARRQMVIAPRVEPRREQLIRAEMLEGLGLARVARLDLGGARTLDGAIACQLAAGPPPERAWGAVDLGGAERAARHLLALDPVASAAAQEAR